MWRYADFYSIDISCCFSSEQQSCPLFPCCPAESASVFLVEGPYISEVKANVNVDLVIRNRAVVIETVIKIPKLLNISKGKEIRLKWNKEFFSIFQNKFSILNVCWIKMWKKMMHITICLLLNFGCTSIYRQ